MTANDIVTFAGGLIGFGILLWMAHKLGKDDLSEDSL